MAEHEWEIRRVRLDCMKPNPDNPRIISKKAMTALKRSIGRFGFVEPIVWNEKTGYIVGGHQRYTLLVEEGVEECFAVVTNFDPADEMAANITLNNPHIEGDWDEPILDLLGHLQGKDETLFKELNFDGLKDALERKNNTGGDDDGDTGSGDDDDVIIPPHDTTCPCCGHNWDVQEDDISLMEVKE
jgi:hypothetical protein